MPTRELPTELCLALRRARDVEGSTMGLDQRRRAVAATGRLMLACVEAGWRIHELVAELGIQRSTGQYRVQAARRRGDTRSGLDVPLAPRTPQRRID